MPERSFRARDRKNRTISSMLNLLMWRENNSSSSLSSFYEPPDELHDVLNCKLSKQRVMLLSTCHIRYGPFWRSHKIPMYHLSVSFNSLLANETKCIVPVKFSGEDEAPDPSIARFRFLSGPATYFAHKSSLSETRRAETAFELIFRRLAGGAHSMNRRYHRSDARKRAPY